MTHCSPPRGKSLICEPWVKMEVILVGFGFRVHILRCTMRGKRRTNRQWPRVRQSARPTRSPRPDPACHSDETHCFSGLMKQERRNDDQRRGLRYDRYFVDKFGASVAMRPAVRCASMRHKLSNVNFMLHYSHLAPLILLHSTGPLSQEEGVAYPWK